MSVRSPFVTGLARLDRTETRTRLLAVRRAVHARIDEIRDHDLKQALLLVSDEVDRILHDTSKHAVDKLANALAVSHGERSLPSAFPRVPVRQVRS